MLKADGIIKNELDPNQVTSARVDWPQLAHSMVFHVYSSRLTSDLNLVQSRNICRLTAIKSFVIGSPKIVGPLTGLGGFAFVRSFTAALDDTKPDDAYTN